MKSKNQKEKIDKYLPSEIEAKWQEMWEKDGFYKFSVDSKKEKYYALVEFTYPSGDLHTGHWFAFAIPDILARMKRMQGYDVFFPNGFDAFGLPAENAAVKRNIHPQDWTLSNIKKMKVQFGLMGASYNWDHEVITCLPEYYKWNQWIFIEMFKKGIAYRSKTLSNWCPVDQTVLANEHVENGKCWRCGSEVVQKEVEQWFLKITAYADKLLWPDPAKASRGKPEKPTVDWPISVRVGQNNWIGKSEGVTYHFKVKDMDIHFKMFDSVPQTFMAQTFTVIAPEHPKVYDLVKGTEHEKRVMEFINKIRKKKVTNKFDIEKETEGVFTGRYVEYGPTKKLLPIWVASFVIATYGTGVVNSSAHDERDFAFAKKYNIELHPVMFPKDKKLAEKVRNLEYCYHHAQDGILEEPKEFKGVRWDQAREPIIDYIEANGWGKRSVQYHLHDWSVSRQRYWGTPVPMVHCEKCGIVPVPEKDLPVELPYDVDYTPKGKPPLASNEKWLNTICPKCGGEAKRDAETLDTFFDSSWYYYRYVDPFFKEGPFDKLKVAKLLPVDIYFGGAEHTLGHTLYARFFTKFFKDLGLIDFDEFAKKRIQHGIVLGPDGNKMSKSKGNVINPDDVVKEFGADAVRIYLAFMMPYEATAPWSTGALYGTYRFLKRVWELFDKADSSQLKVENSESLNIMHRTIKKVGEDIKSIKMNTAVAAMMEWLNFISKKSHVSREEYRVLLLLLAPFAPHMTEELWQKLEVKNGKLKNNLPTLSSSRSNGTPQLAGQFSIHQEKWPEYDEKYLVLEEVTIVVQVNGRVRDNITVESSQVKAENYVEIKARESQKVKKYLDGKAAKKVVYIEGKLINFVTE